MKAGRRARERLKWAFSPIQFIGAAPHTVVNLTLKLTEKTETSAAACVRTSVSREEGERAHERACQHKVFGCLHVLPDKQPMHPNPYTCTDLHISLIISPVRAMHVIPICASIKRGDLLLHPNRMLMHIYAPFLIIFH